VKNLILVVNKDKDYTSRDVVNKLSKILNIKKIGHTGTLDPMATGVLVCLTNKYTKLVDLITSFEKEYIAEIKLGILTDTLDITGNVLNTVDVKNYEEKHLQEVLNSFVGVYHQTVPIYSAKKVNGKKLYEYARNNEVVELPKNDVLIKEIELLEYKLDTIKFRVVVSKGTYIRSLIESITSALGTIGVMSSLVRTKQGNFKLADSYTLEEIASQEYSSVKLEDCLDLEIIQIMNSELEKKILNGNKLTMEYKGFVLFKKNDLDIALYYFEENIGKLKILFTN